jgi:hypothetical protein
MAATAVKKFYKASPQGDIRGNAPTPSEDE